MGITEYDCKEDSWKYVTADELLSKGPCELLSAHVSAASGVAGDVVLYDGENTLGNKIVHLRTGAITGRQFSPPKPIYCRRGLYVDYTTGDGIFVQWRERPSKEG